MNVVPGMQRKVSERRDTSLLRYVTDNNLDLERYRNIARRLSGSAKPEEITSGERDRYNFQQFTETLHRTSKPVDSEWNLMPLSKKVLLCTDLSQQPTKTKHKVKKHPINIIKPEHIPEVVEQNTLATAEGIQDSQDGESSSQSYSSHESSSYESERVDKRCLPKFAMPFMKTGCKNQNNFFDTPERVGLREKMIIQCFEGQDKNQNGARSQENSPERRKISHASDRRGTSIGMHNKNLANSNLSSNTLLSKTWKIKNEYNKRSPVNLTQERDQTSNLPSCPEEVLTEENSKKASIIISPPAANVEAPSRLLTPTRRMLQKFFTQNKPFADIWEAKALNEIHQRRPWSEKELQWAAQKLTSWSCNNGSVKKMPTATSVNTGTIKTMPQVQHRNSEGDSMVSMSDGASTNRSRAYLPYTHNLTAQNYSLGLKHNEYKSERHGSFLEPLITSDKITPEAQEILLVFRDTVGLVIDDIISIDHEITSRNFNPCISLVEHLLMLPNMLIALIDHLHYTPQEFELVSVAKSITNLIDDVSGDPVVVLFRMIELGHNLYYLGRLLGENIVPKDLPRLLYSIQVKLQRMKVGRVVRQYFHIPISFDFIITPYNKDRQLLRLEEDCRCLVNLLHPDDPRSQYCPSGYRTIEVLYDEENGRFETFHHRLNRILSPRRCTARLVTTILRQFNGHEMAMTAEHASDLLNSDHRPKYEDIRALVVSGSRYSREKRLSQRS